MIQGDDFMKRKWKHNALKKFPVALKDFLVMLEASGIAIALNRERDAVIAGYPDNPEAYLPDDIVCGLIKWRKDIVEMMSYINLMHEVNTRVGKQKTPLKKHYLGALGNKLKDLREEKEFTRGVVARIIGVKWKTIDAWEKGLSSPAISSLEKLAHLYECPIGELKKLRAYS